MSQLKVFTWTNANPAVAHNIDCGFTVTEVTTIDTTNGGSWYWNSQMADASSLDVDSGAYSASNGVTPLSQNAILGATISGFTNANPGVITATAVDTVGFAAGDSITVGSLADDSSQTDSLNGTFTVASVTATTITLDENTSSYSVYVSGGIAMRVSDTDGAAVASDNFAIQGVTIGTTPVGANSAVMTAVCRGENAVT